MIIEVLLFAAAREVAGSDRIRVELSSAERPRLADLRRAVANEVPQLGGILANSRFAVGQDFVGEQYVLSADEEVALIPPVSGG